MTYNKIVAIDDSNSNRFLEYVDFTCRDDRSTGSSYSCESDVFSGYNTGTTTQKVFGLKEVTFDSGFYSSLFPDDKSLDFVLTFSYAAEDNADANLVTHSSMSVLHAYTIHTAKLTTANAAYVNWFNIEYSAPQNRKTNEGVNIPTFLRLKVLSLSTSELNGGDRIAIFLDKNIRNFFLID